MKSFMYKFLNYFETKNNDGVAFEVLFYYLLYFLHNCISKINNATVDCNYEVHKSVPSHTYVKESFYHLINHGVRYFFSKAVTSFRK